MHDMSVALTLLRASRAPFDPERARRGVRALNAEAPVLTVSARSGQGMDSWCDHLRKASGAKRNPARTT